ncbi:dTMP kinase [Thermobrachium celere]|uniref:Thymidylate kinase n=1 Tax=Thermobrachium celere DSM 8682 TaxID=941824 RepID=R7RPD2_9CLOT|nr:dTMP kinase [Thermobrachium celere]GFR36214.1 thymidylate kinase [Thermobrachium celere]CDF57173.1 Thymidylate kinase [Thermobrachium celere DSM 8682]
MKGLFITFEGPDGAGKTTQINMLKEYLTSKGYDVVLTREPGGTAIGEKIRNVILDVENKEMDDICEALLYAASRAQHVKQLILPSIDQGKIVICDRFVESSIVYQGYARGLGEDKIEAINNIATRGLVPDVVFLLMLTPEEGIKRKKKSGELDRLEMEKLEFHNRVYEGYNRLKERRKNIFEIDATLDIDDIHNRIVRVVESLLREE